MPLISEEIRAQIKEARRHPVVWWKGAHLPNEQIRPWEGGIQFVAEGFKGFMRGFEGMRDRLYLGMGEGRIPPNWKSIHDVIRVTWDALTDPPIGAFMDRKRFSINTLRWIMRVNATLSPIFIMLLTFYWGLTPFQRVVQWTLFAFFRDAMSTTNVVSETKLLAGITPNSEQRGIIQLCRMVGDQVSDIFAGIPMALMGFTDVFNFTQYQIMVVGAIIFAPITIAARWLPSYAMQRVDFTQKVRGDSESEEQAERPPTIRECFAVVKHNRWFMMHTIVNLVRAFMPGTDYIFLFRFLITPLNIRGNEIGGEVIWLVKNIIFGLPIQLFQPFALTVVNKFPSKLSFIRLQEFIGVAAHIGMYFAGYSNWPRLILLFTIEAIRGQFDLWGPVPRELIRFEMFDYVEWKTGQRSEGMTAAVDGLLRKLLRDNIGNFVGNAVMQWTGYLGYQYPREEQPERFLRSIWPLTHWGRIAGGILAFVALMWFKFPHNPTEVERDLIERRALVQKMEEDATLVSSEI